VLSRIRSSRAVAAWREGGLRAAAASLGNSVVWRIVPGRRAEYRRFRSEQEEDRRWDALHHVSTGGDVELRRAGVPEGEAARGNTVYRPVWESVFRPAMAALDLDLRRFVFLDYGSGKGKALFLAADHSFKRIIGVEYAPHLHEAAEENIARYVSDRQRCRDITSVFGDATAFEPPAEPLVAFFFNPFDEATFGRVLDRLERSARQHPRPVYLVYVNHRTVKEMEHVFAARPLALRDRTPQRLIYEVVLER
jgi:hypothetical protein